MSFSPESFDRLLADKLAQAPPPAYEPAHWDQLEDQLQHLNSALQQAANPASGGASVGAPAAAPLVGKLAILGFSALLTGLTVINGYFFYATTTAREQPAAPAIQVPVSTLATEPFVSETAAPPVATVQSVAARPRGVRFVRPMTKQVPPSAPAPATNLTTPAVATAVLVTAEPSVVVPSPAPPVSAASTEVLHPDTVAVPTRPAVELPASRLSLTIPDIITPNGDGRNDRFELPLPTGTCRLTVFDRANKVVFSAEGYDNSWDGGTLPAGTYLYLIETTGAAIWRTSGPLTITR